MDREDRLGCGVLQHALLDHRWRALYVLFGGLKDELDRPRQFIPYRCECLGDTERDGRVNIVAADVADARGLRGEGHRIRRAGLNRVHVGAVGDDGPRHPAAQNAYDAVPSDPRLDFETERAQPGRHDAGRPLLLTRDLRVPVDISTQFDQIRPHALETVIDPVDERLVLRVRCGTANGEDEDGDKVDPRRAVRVAHLHLPLL